MHGQKPAIDELARDHLSKPIYSGSRIPSLDGGLIYNPHSDLIHYWHDDESSMCPHLVGKNPGPRITLSGAADQLLFLIGAYPEVAPCKTCMPQIAEYLYLKAVEDCDEPGDREKVLDRLVLMDDLFSALITQEDDYYGSSSQGFDRWFRKELFLERFNDYKSSLTYEMQFPFIDLAIELPMQYRIIYLTLNNDVWVEDSWGIDLMLNDRIRRFKHPSTLDRHPEFIEHDLLGRPYMFNVKVDNVPLDGREYYGIISVGYLPSEFYVYLMGRMEALVLLDISKKAGRPDRSELSGASQGMLDTKFPEESLVKAGINALMMTGVMEESANYIAQVMEYNIKLRQCKTGK